MSYIKGGPEAVGLYRCENPAKGPLDDLKWGLCHCYDASWQWNSIRRFESYFPRAA